ncbi:hypothetical protein V7122_10255 [Bacillus sp. JJ1532]|uniref:hypothetical protein n=1 Tax=Bacillus sp. JJ1532 TaxID=3122958 RepID=UPI003000D2FF
MKKVMKMIGIGFISFIVLLMSAALVFGSSKHGDLKGSEETKAKEFMKEFVRKAPFDGTILVLHKGLDKDYHSDH